ncbi:MAG: hypothetical protein JWL77_177 [Chthonomonadaceae bacterium]|nr:hypothetical protein [Chthonomonadaceae bacterium]
MTQGTETPPKSRADQDREQLERYEAFLTAIQQLYETDRGKIAALKRSAGDTLAEARGLAWFEYYLLRYMPPQNRRSDSICLLVASLMTFDRKTMREGVKRGNRDFGAALSSLRSPEEQKAARPGQTPLERRLVILLDAGFDEEGGGEMAFRLRQAVKFALSKNGDISIDWPLLLRDMLRWNWPGKQVQKQWARSFYAVPTTSPTSDADAALDPDL